MTKKVRLTSAEAQLLATLADEGETTESDVLRRGLRLQERMRRRADNIDALVELVADEEPETVPYRLEE